MGKRYSKIQLKELAMEETSSPGRPQDPAAPARMRPGQWILLVVGALLSGAGAALLLGAALASLIPGPTRWRLGPHLRIDFVTDWDAQQAAEAWDHLQEAIPALLATGAAVLAIGVAAVLLGAAGLGRDIDPHRRNATGTAARTVPAGAVQGDSVQGDSADAGPTYPVRLAPTYPVRFTGLLEEPPSRGLWLVKWLLAIPHYIVLALLWFALFITTVAAGLVILFTGRYPRAWFCFNVGVLRWSWRVGFYGYSALATDRYPPFTLAPTNYPADLSIAYPQQLSHGLVLVKSWLLAVPHLLLIGIFTGPSGAGWQRTWDDTGSAGGQTSGGGFSLLGLLLLITAVILLFTGEYRHGIFDFVMGLNRWGNRVAAYVLLMRDEYPPFRLDQGPTEPEADPSSTISGAGERPRTDPSTWTDWV